VGHNQPGPGLHAPIISLKGKPWQVLFWYATWPAFGSSNKVLAGRVGEDFQLDREPDFAIINRSNFKETPMATTTVPTAVPEATPKKPPVSLTPNAVAKVKEIMAQQNPVPAGLRVGVVGGGCSGFSYSMSFENGAGMMDKVFDMDGLKVYVDATSLMYLNNCIVDYVETLEGAGFKFENPNVKSTCGCGSSFSV